MIKIDQSGIDTTTVITGTATGSIGENTGSDSAGVFFSFIPVIATFILLIPIGVENSNINKL